MNEFAVSLVLILGMFLAAVAWAQEPASIEGARWFDGWENRELVIRENRFMLTDHNAQATFRGTFVRDGENVRPMLDPRATVFLDGPTSDVDKVRHIRMLVQSGELTPIFGSAPCAAQESRLYRLELEITEWWLSLSAYCGAEHVDSMDFERVNETE